jgi:hypothetical protein
MSTGAEAPAGGSGCRPHDVVAGAHETRPHDDRVPCLVDRDAWFERILPRARQRDRSAERPARRTHRRLAGVGSPVVVRVAPEGPHGRRVARGVDCKLRATCPLVLRRDVERSARHRNLRVQQPACECGHGQSDTDANADRHCGGAEAIGDPQRERARAVRATAVGAVGGRQRPFTRRPPRMNVCGATDSADSAAIGVGVGVGGREAAGSIASARCFESAIRSLSVTVAVTLYVPAVVGVPVIAPLVASIVRPPNSPSRFQPNAYRSPVDVTTRLNTSPPAVWTTGPVAPGSVTSAAVGLAVFVPVFVGFPSWPPEFHPNAYSSPGDAADVGAAAAVANVSVTTDRAPDPEPRPHTSPFPATYATRAHRASGELPMSSARLSRCCCRWRRSARVDARALGRGPHPRALPLREAPQVAGHPGRVVLAARKVHVRRRDQASLVAGESHPLGEHVV